MAYIELKKPRHFGHNDRRDERIVYTEYERSLPFFAGPKNKLIHRVKAIVHLDPNFSPSNWFIIDYWCENGGRSYDLELDVVEDIPADRVLCARCEARAVANGEKSADELCGHHVHVGGLQVVQQCCRPDRN